MSAGAGILSGAEFMDQRLSVGVIGCGAISQIMHIPYLVDDEQFQLVALSDVYQPVLDAVADRYHIADRYVNYRDLLARQDIQAVIIAHSGNHRETVLAALDAGKDIFVEKPITWNAREAQEVAMRVAATGRIVQVGYHKLYDPAFAYTKAEVAKMHDLALLRISVLHPANELGFSPHRLRRGNGLIVEGHVDIGTWEAQVSNQLNAFSGSELGPLVDEALGARRDNPNLRRAYGILASSIIHQIYTMFGFLGAPKRAISTDVWREGMSISAMIEYSDTLRCELDWHFLMDLKDYREEYAFYGNRDRVILQFPSPYFRNFPSPVTIQGGEGGSLSRMKKPSATN
jgi:CheY-like chemotaxis protein